MQENQEEATKLIHFSGASRSPYREEMSHFTTVSSKDLEVLLDFMGWGKFPYVNTSESYFQNLYHSLLHNLCIYVLIYVPGFVFLHGFMASLIASFLWDSVNAVKPRAPCPIPRAWSSTQCTWSSRNVCWISKWISWSQPRLASLDYTDSWVGPGPQQLFGGDFGAENCLHCYRR